VREEEEIRVSDAFQGEHRDVLLDANGRVVWESPWEHNVIVDTARSLIAALLKGDSQGAAIARWAVGAGEAVWDQSAPPPDAIRRTRSQLFAETGRKTIAAGQIIFLGGTLTNRLEITSSFTTADVPAGPLREFGLFAGGTNAANTGVLVNHRVHPRIDMQAGFTLQRTLRLTF
jgi:hypothetical protein